MKTSLYLFEALVKMCVARSLHLMPNLMKLTSRESKTKSFTLETSLELPSTIKLYYRAGILSEAVMLYFNTAAGAIQYPCSQLLLLGLNLFPCKAWFHLACHTFFKQKVADTSTHSQELKIITSDACCLVLDQS